MGAPGPGGGYALKLARERYAGIELSQGEERENVVIGLSVLVGKRAGIFGRDPIIYDVDFFLKIFNFGSPVDAPFAGFRKRFFRGAAQSYLVQRQLADSVPESILSMNFDMLATLESPMKLFKLLRGS